MPLRSLFSHCGELGRKEAASAVNELLEIDPEFAVHARRYIEPWHYASGLMPSLLEGLQKAGLEIANGVEHTVALTPDPESTRQSAFVSCWLDQGPLIAHLFKDGMMKGDIIFLHAAKTK